MPAWLTPSVRSGTIAPGAIQPIAFTGADTLSGGTYTANVVATIGATTLPLALTVTVDATPSWSVDASRFQHTMSVTAQLFLRGRPSVDASDRVAAFVGGELRGVASVTPRTSSGQPSPDSNRVALTVYSNALSGEIVTFKVWDADQVAPVLYSATSRSLAFQADAIEGTPTRPLAIHAPYVPGAGTVALNAGWTWVSFPRVPASGTVTGMLSPFFGASPVSGDVVKSQRSFSVFTGSGRIGRMGGSARRHARRPAAGVHGAPLVLAGHHPRIRRRRRRHDAPGRAAGGMDVARLPALACAEPRPRLRAWAVQRRAGRR